MSELDNLFNQYVSGGKAENKPTRAEFKPLILDDDTQDIDVNKKDQQTIPQYVDVDKPKFVQPERRSYFVAGNVNNNEINTTAQKPNEIEYEANTIDNEKKKDDYFALTKLSINKKDIVKNAIKYITGAANPIQSAINTVGAFTGKDDKEIVLEGVRGFTGSTIDFASSLYRFFKQNADTAKTYTKEQLDKIANLGNVAAGGESFANDIAEQYTEFYKQIDEENKILRDKTERFLQYTGIAKTDKDGFIYDLVGGGASLMYAIGLAAITKSPAAAAEMFGMYQYQSLYEEGIDRGFSPIKARAIGVAGGAFEGGLEMVGLHVLIETLKARRSFTKILKAALTEFTQEASQQGAEEILAKLSGLREDSTVGQIISNVFYAGVIGAILGGGSATVSNVFYKQISDSATRELINNGMQSDYAKQMVDNVLKLSVSPQAAQEVVSISKDEQSPVTYKNADPRETYKETGEAIKKALDPQQKRGVELEFIEEKKKFVDSVAKALINSGKFTEEEAYKQAEAQANLADGLARIGFEQDNIRPSEYYKRFKVDVTSGNIETDERNVDEENPFVDVSFDPVDFDDQARAEYEAAMDAQQEEMDKLQKEFTMSLKDHAKFFRDIGVDAIRRPTPDGVGKDRWGEYKTLSPRIKNYFFSDDPTAMSWDDAEKLLAASSSDIKDLFAYLSNADEKAKVYNQKEVFSKVLAKEKEDIKQKAIADGTFMKAPNGKDSNLPEQLWLTVRTKAFKNWFGDWLNDPQNASKVVDENGEPLVVYHGTNAKFSKFRESIDGGLGRGIYFTEDELFAKSVIINAQVMPVFLNIRNPYITTYPLNNKENEQLRQEGYDGIYHKGNRFWVTFDTKQVKSINNRGTFDKNNPDIYYQPAYHGTAYRFDEFSTDKIGKGEGAQVHGWGLYFAENKDVSDKRYRERLLNRNRQRYVVKENGKEIDQGLYQLLDNHLSGNALYDAANGDPQALKKAVQFTIEVINDELSDKRTLVRSIKTIQEQIDKIKNNPKISITQFYNEAPADMKGRFYQLIKWAKEKAKEEGRKTNINDVKRNIERNLQPLLETRDKYLREKQELESLDLDNFTVEENKGQLFKVDIPEKDVLLDEQKTFDEQPEKVQKALKKIAEKELIHNIDKNEEAILKYIDKYIQKTYPTYASVDNDARLSYWNTMEDLLLYGKERTLNIIKHNVMPQYQQRRIDFVNSIKDIDQFIISKYPIDFDNYNGKSLTGREIYNLIASRINGSDDAFRDASLLLNKYGIKGITYDGLVDGRAYVIFDDKAVKVLEKFYQPAYHGTPHRFDTFSTEKIGTGEGAQAHGWGLYFAKERAVSEDYRKNLTNNDGTIYVDGKEIEDKNFGEDFYARRNTIKGKTLKEKLLNYKDKLVERIDWNNKNIEYLTKQMPLYEKLVKELRKNKTADKTEIEDILEKNSDGIKTDVIAAWQDLLDAAADPYEQMNTEEGYDNELNSENVASYFEGEIFDKQSQIKQSEKDINNFEKKLKTIESIDLDNAELKGYGQVLQVDIPEDNVLLDEDKRFHEQPEKVQEALNKIFKEIYKIDKKEFINYIDKKYANHEKHDAIMKELKKVIDGTKDNGSAVLANLDYNDTKKILFLYRSGRYIYGEIEDRLGSDKAASLLLNKYGIKGIKYNGGWDGRAYVVFDDKAVKVLEKYYQEQQQEQPRGATTVFDRQYFINLFTNADKSTLMHEMAHAWLSEINYFAKAKNATQKVLDLKKQLDNWLGVPDNNGRYSVEQQEKFAENFEIYLKEGKAPTAKLKTVFARFKTWLSEIYDRIKDDLPKLSDDVRELFDNILSRSYDVPDSNIYAGKEKAIKEVIKNIQEGRASEVDGITIDDVYNLLNMAYTRKPNRPSKNLKQLLNDKNIYDFNELNKAGADTVLAILKDGGYVKEDATAETAMDLARKALDGEPVYRLADQWRVAGDIDFARNLRVLERVIEFSQIDSTLEKILELQQEGYRNVEQGDVEQVQNDYKRLFSADVKEAKKIVEDIINRLHKKRFIDRAAQKQMLVDLNFSSTVEEIRESVLNVIEDLQDEIKLVKEQLRNPRSRKPIVRKDRTIPPAKDATEEEKNTYKKYMRKQINRLLKQALPRKQNQQKFSKFDVETQRFFTDLENYNKMTIEAAQEELYKRATSIIDEEGEGLNNFEKMKNMFLSYKANKINQNSTEFYKQLYDNLQEINVFGRNAKEIQETLKKERIQKDINDLVVNIEENKSKNGLTTELKKQYVKWLGNWWSTINAIAGKKQADKDSLEKIEIDIFNKDYSTTENLKIKCAAALGLKNATDLDMTVNRYLNEEYTYNEKDPRSNTENAVKLNKMQLICCYIWMKNSTLRDRIVRAYGNTQIMDMMEKLTIQDKKFGDELQKAVADLYDDVNAVYLKMYGLDMPQAENYFPSSVERIQGNMDLLKDNIGQVSSPGFIKARVQSNLPLMNFGNPVKIALDHITKVNHFVYMQEKLADLNKVYKTTIVKRHITNLYGDNVYRYILQVLDNAKFTTVARTIDGISDVGDYLVNNYVLTKIAIKPSIMIKQLLSCINYAEDMSSVQWFSGFLKGVHHYKKTIDFMMTNSKYCQSRFAKGGQTEALLKAMEGRNATFAKVKTFKGMLSWMTRVGDIGAIIFGGYPLVMDQMSKGVPLEKAIEKFEQATVRSQQASLPSTLSNWQYRGMNSWLYRAMFAFANTPNQYCRKMGDSMYMYFHGDIDKKQLAKNLMIYGCLNSLLYTSFTSLAILSGLVSGNWDDLKDDVIMSLLQTSNVLALPIVSQAYNSFVSRVVTGKFTPDKEIPLLDDMIKIMRTATKEDLEFNDYLNIVDEVGSLVLGVPIKTLYNGFVGSTKDLLDGEYGKFAVKLYGATESRANKIFD